MDLSKYPVLHPQVAARVVDGSAVIVLADSGQVNVLNQVGTRIWDLIDGTRNVQDLVRVVENEYTVTPETALRDVQAFLQSLLDADAVTLQDRPV